VRSRINYVFVLSGVTLSGVCWLPVSRLLLFSMALGEVHVYDAMGGFVVSEGDD
jgi:hypothetical protein